MNVFWRNGRIEDHRTCEAEGLADWGAFTTVGCDAGRPLLWDLHSRRLAASLVALGVGSAPTLPTENQLRELLFSSNLSGSARLRVVVRRVESSKWDVLASARSCRAAGPVAEPVKLTVQRWDSAPPLAGHKTLARMAWDLARERARHNGFDDALLVDSCGRLLETSVANIWILKDGSARTPRAPGYCLPGVMRQWLLQNLGKAGLVADVGELTLCDLVNADEVWLSNAVIGVRRVSAIDDRRWRESIRFDCLDSLGIPAPGW